MKRLLLASLLAGFAFAATAQSTVGVATQPTTQPDAAHSSPTARDVRDHTCLSHTGSLITSAQNRQAVRRARDQHAATVDVKCADFGRAYTRDDIERTGAIDLADALRRLDPAVH
jgi:hypothetical protein